MVRKRTPPTARPTAPAPDAVTGKLTTAPARAASSPAARRTPADSSAEAEQRLGDRLVRALASDFDTAYRLATFLADDDTAEEEVVEHVALLALHSPSAVARGQEQAWVLRTLVKLLGADASEGRRGRGDRDLPVDLHRRRAPVPSQVIGHTDATRALLDDALRDLDKRTRASILLVVAEGLSIDDAVGVQGGSRRAFARRYASGVATLGPAALEALLGQSGAPALG